MADIISGITFDAKSRETCADCEALETATDDVISTTNDTKKEDTKMESTKIKIQFEGGYVTSTTGDLCTGDFMAPEPMARIYNDAGEAVRREELIAELAAMDTPYAYDAHDTDYDDVEFDEYAYLVLRADAIEKAKAAGIDPSRLVFQWGDYGAGPDDPVPGRWVVRSKDGEILCDFGVSLPGCTDDENMEFAGFRTVEDMDDPEWDDEAPVIGPDGRRWGLDELEIVKIRTAGPDGPADYDRAMDKDVAEMWTTDGGVPVEGYAAEARRICDALRCMSAIDGGFDALEVYLSYHAGSWLMDRANTPSGLANELESFAEMAEQCNNEEERG